MKATRTPLGSIPHALLAMSAVLLACQQSSPGRDASDTGAASARPATTITRVRCDDDARRIVEQVGLRMRRVSLPAPPAAVARDLADAYSDLATPELIAAWGRTPAKAPGRETSNPWPARVEIDSMRLEGRDCRVDGHVVFVTTTDTNTAVERRRVTVSLRDSGGWRVNGWEAAADDHPVSQAPNTSGDTLSAIAVVRRYLALVATRKYDSAYALWADGGRASHQTRAEFAAGYSKTEVLTSTVGGGVRVEGAAGSQYATVPVVIDATLRDGRHQHFAGTYTVRRSMVDGATAEQRSWRIYSAAMREG